MPPRSVIPKTEPGSGDVKTEPSATTTGGGNPVPPYHCLTMYTKGEQLFWHKLLQSALRHGCAEARPCRGVHGA